MWKKCKSLKSNSVIAIPVHTSGCISKVTNIFGLYFLNTSLNYIFKTYISEKIYLHFLSPHPHPHSVSQPPRIWFLHHHHHHQWAPCHQNQWISFSPWIVLLDVSRPSTVGPIILSFLEFFFDSALSCGPVPNYSILCLSHLATKCWSSLSIRHSLHLTTHFLPGKSHILTVVRLFPIVSAPGCADRPQIYIFGLESHLSYPT